MIQRMLLDLGEARDNEARMVKYWKYFYVGSCDGDVTIKFNNKRNNDLTPDEFSKITDLEGVIYLIFNNTAQEGKELVLYYEEKKGGWW